MKRFYAFATALGLFASVGLVGCGEENKTTTQVEQKTPEGTTKEKVTTETTQSGENPPLPTGTSGEPGPK